MNVPILEEAIAAILKGPVAFDADEKRTAAVDRLLEMDYGVYVASRPQGSEPVAITIEAAGGVPKRNVDSPSARAESIIDLTFWSRDPESNRGNVRGIYELMHLSRVILVGLYTRSTFKDVEICDILVESEPFTSDEDPSDKSDGWTSKLTMSYVVFWRRADSSNIIAGI